MGQTLRGMFHASRSLGVVCGWGAFGEDFGSFAADSYGE